MTLSLPSEAQITTRLQADNPWWATGKTDAFYRSLHPRLFFHRFYSLVQENRVQRACILMGPRRVGKTVMLFHAVQQLIDQGVAPQQILFASVETPIYQPVQLEHLLTLARKASGQNPDSLCYVFLDEIQYLSSWELHLKTLVDTYRNIRFVASGSAAAALKLKSNESGAGRFTDTMLPPLTFYEYIHLCQLDDLMQADSLTWQGNIPRYASTPHLGELNKHFLQYLNFGGYPEVIFNPYIQQNPERYLRADIVDKVLLRDLPGLYGIQNIQELNALFSMIAWNSGQEFSIDQLSQGSGVRKNIIRQYLTYLEAAFLIRTHRRIDQKAGRFQRENFFKIYLSNPSLRTALFAPIRAESDHMGPLVETAVLGQNFPDIPSSEYYARWKNGEVDWVHLHPASQRPEWAVEIKWSNRAYHSTQELKSLLAFCKANDLDQALVTTIDKAGHHHSQGINLHFIPASVYAYNLGKNALLPSPPNFIQ